MRYPPHGADPPLHMLPPRASARIRSMGQFSLKRLFAGVTLVAIGAAIFAALSKGLILFGSPEVAASLGGALVAEGLFLPMSKKPLEHIIVAMIGAALGYLTIPAT